MPVAAITGITGSQGGAAARHLKRAGWQIRGLTRNLSGKGAQRLAADGIELVEGDMGDPAVLDRLLRGVDGVYAVTDFFHNGLEREVQQGKAIADAAKRANVKHFVFPSLALSELKTGVPYFEAKAEIERHVAALALPATILRLSMFMEDLVETKYAPPIWWGTVRRCVGADKKLLWIAVDDVGAVVAKVLADPGRFKGQVIALAGDIRSLAEAREIFVRVAGKAPLAIPLPLWLCRIVINEDLVPFWRWLGRNPIDGSTEPARAIHPDMKTLEAWLRERTAAHA